jgi:hypothetical protein
MTETAVQSLLDAARKFVPQIRACADELEAADRKNKRHFCATTLAAHPQPHPPANTPRPRLFPRAQGSTATPPEYAGPRGWGGPARRLGSWTGAVGQRRVDQPGATRAERFGDRRGAPVASLVRGSVMGVRSIGRHVRGLCGDGAKLSRSRRNGYPVQQLALNYSHSPINHEFRLGHKRRFIRGQGVLWAISRGWPPHTGRMCEQGRRVCRRVALQAPAGTIPQCRAEMLKISIRLGPHNACHWQGRCASRA